MTSTVYLVTGASRGIGLETVRQLSQLPDARVVAAARDPSSSAALQELVNSSEGRVQTVVLDVTSEESIAAAVKATVDIPFVAANNASIDVLLLIAGTMSSGWKAATQVSAAELRIDIDANFIGSVLTTLAFLPVLKTSPRTDQPTKVVYMSTLLSSASLLPSLGPHATVAASYSASKAAANQWFRKLALEIASGTAGIGRDGGWAVGLIHPGLVSTDMTRYRGDIAVDESVRGVLAVVDSLDEAQTGGFWDWKGQRLSF